MQWKKVHGVIVATFTPFTNDGKLNLSILPKYIEHLESVGVHHAFVNGTAAESMSLTVPERKQIAETWMKEGPKHHFETIILHIGTGNLEESKELARHAESIKVHAISAMVPSYFKPTDVESAVDYCAEIAREAPNTPFIYYHFPAATACPVRTYDFVRVASKRIPTLVGVKHTDSNLADVAQAHLFENEKYEMILGADGMILGGLVMGIDSTIGIGWSLMGRPCQRMIDAFRDGKLDVAKREQYKIQEAFEQLHCATGGHNQFIRCIKAAMQMAGLDLGPPRLPIKPLSDAERAQIKAGLEAMGFWLWIK